eukprot:3325484-Amphidinium_carterae.1
MQGPHRSESYRSEALIAQLLCTKDYGSKIASTVGIADVVNDASVSNTKQSAGTKKPFGAEDGKEQAESDDQDARRIAAADDTKQGAEGEEIGHKTNK